MFTGIIESLARVQKIEKKNNNTVFTLKSCISSELKVDQSLCHNGVCLTVESCCESTYQVTAIRETLEKSNLGGWKIGDLINLERSLMVNGRLDGHIVQGHVDGTGICLEKKEAGGSWLFTFQFEPNFFTLVIEKGSICVNGVSLTCFNINKHNFTVAIIPYTYEKTNFHRINLTDEVNLEFDVLGKYVQRFMNLT